MRYWDSLIDPWVIFNIAGSKYEELWGRTAEISVSRPPQFRWMEAAWMETEWMEAAWMEAAWPPQPPFICLLVHSAILYLPFCYVVLPTKP
jgi:hypothetical protein